MNIELAKEKFAKALSAAGVSSSDTQLFDLVIEVPFSSTNPQLVFQPVEGSRERALPTSILLGQNDAFFGFQFSLGIKKVQSKKAAAVQVFTYPEKSVFVKDEEQRGLTAYYNGIFNFQTQIGNRRSSPILRLSTQNFLIIPPTQMRQDLQVMHQEQYIDLGFSYLLTGSTSAQEFSVTIGDCDLTGIDDEGRNFAVFRIKGLLAVGAGKAIETYLSR